MPSDRRTHGRSWLPTCPVRVLVRVAAPGGTWTWCLRPTDALPAHLWVMVTSRSAQFYSRAIRIRRWYSAFRNEYVLLSAWAVYSFQAMCFDVVWYGPTLLPGAFPCQSPSDILGYSPHWPVDWGCVSARHRRSLLTGRNKAEDTAQAMNDEAKCALLEHACWRGHICTNYANARLYYQKNRIIWSISWTLHEIQHQERGRAETHYNSSSSSFDVIRCRHMQFTLSATLFHTLSALNST